MDRSLAPRLRGFATTQRVKRGSRSVSRWGLIISQHGRLRHWMIASLLALLSLTGGWLWLRDSSLVAVRHVQISGVRGVDSRAIELALGAAAKHMSTMDVNLGELRAAVASYPQVREVRASTSFPHSMHILVAEQPPVATLLVDGQRTALAADGVVLGRSLVSSSLPVIDGSRFPGKHISEAPISQYLAILGAAPAPFQKLLTRIFTGPKGITVRARNGMLIYFGDATRPHAKWLSLARVLLAPSSAGATYVDVRLPERPAAGMSGEGVPAPDAQASGLDPTSAALAESLASAVSGDATQTTGVSSSTAVAPVTSESEASASNPVTSAGNDASSPQE